jgi:hypothetical protein
MGFFDSLFGSKNATNCEVAAERIWMTADAKFAGLARNVAELSQSETAAILLVAHFPDVLARLSPLADKTAMVPVMAVLARDLSKDIAASLHLDKSASIEILVGERHPLPSVDERLEEFAGGLPCRCRLVHHLSLDDPMIKVFAGDWVQGVLKQLGMTDEECIESEMVARRIKQAQRKIEGKAFGGSEAESAAAWFKKHCPELASKGLQE